MSTRFYTLLLGCSLLVICVSFQCRKVPIYQYRFEEKLNLAPAQKTYQAGDTIWVSFTTTDKSLIDKFTNQPVLVDEASIPFYLNFRALYNTAENPPGGFCDFITPLGLNYGKNFGNWFTSTSFTFGCNNPANFDVTVGIILTKTGIFGIELHHLDFTLMDCPGRPQPFPLSSIKYSFNVTEGNMDVYLTIPGDVRALRPGDPDWISDKTLYVLRVI